MSMLPRCSCGPNAVFGRYDPGCNRHHSAALWWQQQQLDRREQWQADLDRLRQQATTRPTHGGYPDTRP